MPNFDPSPPRAKLDILSFILISAVGISAGVLIALNLF